LSVTNNTLLKDLSCGNNLLTTLNVSSNTALTYLACTYNQLSSLTVLANTALNNLNCAHNLLTALNVSGNTALVTLDCSNNQLNNLNLTGATALTTLFCFNNSLTALDVSTNTSLTDLSCFSNQLSNMNLNTALLHIYCYNNKLTDLDISALPAAVILHCYNNLLTSLNIKNGNNTNFAQFDASGNSNLSCIQVDNPSYSASAPNWTKDAGASYSQNCVSGISNHVPEKSILLYPNPSKGILFVNVRGAENAKVCLRDILGNCLWSKDCPAGTDLKIDLTDKAKGIYFAEIQEGNKKSIKKIVIE